MNYDEFFSDIAKWVQVCNENVKRYGLHSNEFWSWVSYSLAKICERYNNHDLVITQSIMLWDWLEEKNNKVNFKEKYAYKNN